MRIIDGDGETRLHRMEPGQAFMGCFLLCLGLSLLIVSSALLIYVLRLG